MVALPCRYQHSRAPAEGQVGIPGGLNCRVRDGNGCGRSGFALQVLHEVFRRDLRLPQNPSQRTDRQFIMQRHNTAHVALGRLFF